MKKRIIVILLCLSMLLLGLTACADKGDNGDGGNGGGGGGDSNNSTNPSDFSYYETSYGYAIKEYNGTEKNITLPSKHANGTAITAILYEVKANADDNIYPFEGVETIHIPVNMTILANSGDLQNENLVQSVFSGAKELKSITVDANNRAFVSIDGVLYNKSQTVLLACPYQKTGELSLPDGLRKIAKTAFYCYSMNGNGVENAVTSSFNDFGTFSSKITSIKIPSSLSEITEFNFYGCRNLTSIDLSNTLIDRIPIGAFKQCLALETIALPDGLKIIGSGAFQNSGLKSISIPSSARGYDDYSQQAKFAIASDMFLGCKNLESVTGPAQLLFGEVGADDIFVENDFISGKTNDTNNFLGCKRLSSITVNGAKAGANGKAFAISDYKKGWGYGNEAEYPQNTFQALTSITYLSGVYDMLDNYLMDNFAEAYPNLIINK